MNSAWHNAVGPFGAFDFGFGFGAKPGVVGHFVSGNAFAPVGLTASRRRQVGERAFVGDQWLQDFEQGAAVGGVQALVDFAGNMSLRPSNWPTRRRSQALAAQTVRANDETL